MSSTAALNLVNVCSKGIDCSVCGHTVDKSLTNSAMLQPVSALQATPQFPVMGTQT